MGIITIIGVLAIIVAIGLIVYVNVAPIRHEATNYESASPKILREWTFTKSLKLAVAGLFLSVLSGVFFYNPAGTATSVQYLWGGDKAVTTQGIKVKFWGRTIPISFEIAMQDIVLPLDKEGNKIGSIPSKDGIYYREGQRREFADAIKADIAASLIVSINYKDIDLFLSMADKNTSEEKLVYARIYPVYDQAVKNTCKLMDAQDYISGASSQFDFYLKDQMENGMYLTEEVYEDVITAPIIKSDSSRLVAQGIVNNEKKREKKYRIRRDKNGDPIRDASNSLKRYGLTIQQAAVTNIDWEESFDIRLQLQKEQVAQTQIEKQEAEKEYYATQKTIAKGEREKAEVRVKLEKQQLDKTISAETKAKEASFKEQEEKNLVAAEVQRAKRIRLAADADAYEISKKVSAGITPEKRLEMELDAKVRMMKALSGPDGIKMPSTIFNGGNGSNGQAGMLESILGAKILSGELGGSKK